ncbi:M14 family zinc carboxypeptidase [Ornithinimicrobium sp. W1679]|uniref:M14 family zinc carboxypeptidase n=1 Tax=Ornithinimicrobium sp. W1679 TaxID=3418770 RepID=UPI003CF4B5B4
MTRSTTTHRATQGLALAVCLALAGAPAAVSAPDGPPDGSRGNGNGQLPGPATSTSGLSMPESYPVQPALRVFDQDPADRSYTGDLLGYADLAPRLNTVMSASDRVSTQVVGQSTQGRDLYLVTVTAPETRQQTTQQTRWRDLIEQDPAKAAKDARLARDYKTPIWFSANIHGNEWEGTDAALRYIEDLAASDDPSVVELLQNHRLYFSLTLNPDGRYLGTRATALGFDANRDMVTNVTPEARSYIELTQALLPLYASDIHGYTGNLQVEPTGPPHGENYEYDLFIPHNYALALQVEQDVVDAAIEGNPLTSAGGIKIPYRDTPSGWDDYPPIFTAQYAAYFGALTATVELPLGRDRTTGLQTPGRAAVNTEVAYEVIDSTVDYVADHDEEILANQIEFFRRAAAGEPKTALTGENIADVPGPDQWKELWDPADDQDPVDLPRAYVIPAGEGQRSASDAASLVEQLQLHGIEVQVLNAPRTLEGTTYPAGSYVVDLHQPHRALVNALLDLGSDISQKVPTMYDVSAWSYSYLWGATVDKVGTITDRAIPGTRTIEVPLAAGTAPKKQAATAFDVAGVTDYRALNDLLDADAEVWMLDDGVAVVSADDHATVVNAAVEHDIAFRPADRAQLAAIGAGEGKALDDLTVGVVGGADHRTSFEQLGFEVVPLTAGGIATDPAILGDVDVLWVGGTFSFNGTNQPAQPVVADWLADGHAIVGAGTAGLGAAAAFGLVEATPAQGPGRANGIVAVDTPEGSILAPHAQEHAFVYPPVWFTGLGATTTVEQSYATDPMLAGHWRATTETNGPDAAAGQASVISGRTAQGSAVVFGTSPLFRTHPKGGLSQVAQAVVWAAPEAAED